MNSAHIPRKRFGQNFLIDQNIIAKIVDTLAPLPDDNLIEVGAGLGALTDLVLKRVHHIHVIEIDKDLCAQLKEMYTSNQITVYQGDVLDFDFSIFNARPNQPLRIFGNLPYNISTPLLFHVLNYSRYFSDMLFMLQKEVVMRLCAQPGTREYGRLSVMIRYQCAVQHLFDIGPNAFSPPPKVMSSIIRIKPYGTQRPFPLANNEKTFFAVVAAAFGHRRKTLKNAVKTLIPASLFDNVGIDPNRRPETLSITEFVNLSNELARAHES